MMRCNKKNQLWMSGMELGQRRMPDPAPAPAVPSSTPRIESGEFMATKTDTSLLVEGMLNELAEISERQFITDDVRLMAEHDWLIRVARALLLIEAKRQNELEQMHDFFQSLGPDLEPTPEESRT